MAQEAAKITGANVKINLINNYYLFYFILLSDIYYYTTNIIY